MSLLFKLRSRRSSAPLQSPATQRNSSTACAAHTGTEACRAASSANSERSGAVVAALRLDEQAVQAEHAGILALRQLLEGGDRRVAIAAELRILVR